MKNTSAVVLMVVILAIAGCRSYQARPYDFPDPVDTTTRPVEMQEKKIYQIPELGVEGDNQFDGARLNALEYAGGDTIRATILPENEPINPSAYYAFRLKAQNPTDITLELNYPVAFHRYPPKISFDGEQWDTLSSQYWQLAADSVNAFLKLSLNREPIWIAAQEITDSEDVRQWCKMMAQHNDAQFKTIGKSKLGRDLFLLDIANGETKKKDIIVIISRQHPPEVTGYMAMEAFVETLLEDTPLSRAFRSKYHILVYPLLNPDGVDLGHWRHNAGGIDLNRDWAYYHQPETEQIANHIVKTTRKNKAEVIIGLDFHSTWYDIFYTNKEKAANLPGFKDYWLPAVAHSLGIEKVNERPSNVGRPVSKNWFLTQLAAEGITYEIGDNTPRQDIAKKGRHSAIEMMQLLILR